MSTSEVKQYIFNDTEIATLGETSKELNWPVVYQIYNSNEIYIGETTNLKRRMSQHLGSDNKNHLERFNVIFDNEYNKSVALDLEAQLIQWFSGEATYSVLNRNESILNGDYYKRDSYRKHFPLIWGKLRKIGIAKTSVTDIENSGIFKFSPYKRLNNDQLNVVKQVLLNIDEAIADRTTSFSIVTGSEGTGKTIVLMYLAKLIRDIQEFGIEDQDEEFINLEFEDFFKKEFINQRFKNKSIALVIPGQSLRGSIRKIIKSISNMRDQVEVLSPIDFGSNHKHYDIALVDEAHLLKSGNQEVHKMNREKVDKINRDLFQDINPHTELDWIIRKSQHVVIIYGDQRIRPNSIAQKDLARYSYREYVLRDQMRSRGGKLYIDYLKEILSNTPPKAKQNFNDFEFKLFYSFREMNDAIKSKEHLYGLSRLVAGFAWPWKSKKNKSLYDIKIEGEQFRWNSDLNDWVGSAKSTEEIGSIYTLQGYDLNYCGVIIGEDLQYDKKAQKIMLNRSNYHDRGAKKRTKHQLDQNIILTDDELLDQVVRVYRILMNRSIRGTYVYVCNPELRKYLSKYIDIK